MRISKFLKSMVLSSALVCACISAPAANVGPNCDYDAMLVFDASSSMSEFGYSDQRTTRIVEARGALHRVLPQVAPFRRLGLIVYGPGERHACANVSLRLRPTANAAAEIITQIDRTEPGGNTPLTKSVSLAAEILKYREKPGEIVVVTDGRDTCSGSPCTLASKLAEQSSALVVHVIGFQIRGENANWQSQQADEPGTGVTIARCLADFTGGTYVSTETAEQLIDALQRTLGCQAVSRFEPSQMLKIQSVSSGAVG